VTTFEGAHLTASAPGRRKPQLRHWSGHNRHGPKSEGLLCPFPWGRWVTI